MTAAATTVALLMIAAQIASKATRDAIFLSNYDVTSLPIVLISSSITSLLAVVAISRLMRVAGPATLIPFTFALSALLLLGEWWLSFAKPAIAALAIYLHVATFGAILISGFWSLINETLDPRTGKKVVARIATGATLGGLAGGILAERVSVVLSTNSMLPLLAFIHLLCALILLVVTRSERRQSALLERRPKPEGAYASGSRILREQPYLRSLALLVLFSTVTAALIDYIFKAQASSVYSRSEELLRFFAIYYTIAGLATVVFQGGFSRLFLQKLGLVRTVGTLPVATGVSALGAFLAPGLFSITIARGTEAILRNSLYRSAYELLYTPVPKVEKRATKSIIDVGFERLGDALGGGVVRILLFAGPALAHPLMLFLAVVLGILSLFVSMRLQRGYIRALERSLQERMVELDETEIEDGTTRTVVRSLKLSHLDPLRSYEGLGEKPHPATENNGEVRAVSTSGRRDPVLEKLADLRSGDPERIQKTLSSKDLDPSLIPEAIQLLAWDELAADVVHALRRKAPQIVGQLLDTLFDGGQEFSIRRRIPRVLAAAPLQRTVDGLILGLEDRRFEVRFQCGRVLAHLTRQHSSLKVDPEDIFEAVHREVLVDRGIWDSHRLLDHHPEEDSEADFYIGEFVRNRADRSLEHVFTLLSIVIPHEPLRIAYRGLHTKDDQLRGTSLEYLESVLPEKIRRHLWPYLENKPPMTTPRRSREEVLQELLSSNLSIQFNLDAIRKKFEDH